MKAIIAVLNAFKFREENLHSFHYVSKMLNGKVTVIFLENEVYREYATKDSTETITLEAGLVRYKGLQQRFKSNLIRAQRICKVNNYDFNFHDSYMSVSEIINESRFADLLITNQDISFSDLYETDPSFFIKNLMADAQCPVLKLPENVEAFNEVVFSYNGTLSSMYAIKQFTRFFSPMVHKKVSVIYVAEHDELEIPYREQLDKYLKAYYQEIEYTVLEGIPDKVFLNTLSKKQDCIVTFGAYGRSTFSNFFKAFKVNNILRKINIPVFITQQ
jgi:hypothetical protein